VAAAFLLGACGSAAYQTRPLPSQEVEVSRPDLARIYVVREGQIRGKLWGLRVEDSDEDIGALDQGDYLCWERAPGRTLLTIVFEGPPLEGGEREALFSLDAEAGHAYYLVIHIDRRAESVELQARSGQPDIELVSADAGRALVHERRPVPVR